MSDNAVLQGEFSENFCLNFYWNQFSKEVFRSWASCLQNAHEDFSSSKIIVKWNFALTLSSEIITIFSTQFMPDPFHSQAFNVVLLMPFSELFHIIAVRTSRGGMRRTGEWIHGEQKSEKKFPHYTFCFVLDFSEVFWDMDVMKRVVLAACQKFLAF